MAVSVNVKVTLPAFTPVTTPAFVTVATAVLLLVQVPPLVGVRVIVSPAHTVAGAETSGSGLTLISMTALTVIPFPSVTVTVYSVVAVSVATGSEIVELLNPVSGLHE